MFSKMSNYLSGNIDRRKAEKLVSEKSDVEIEFGWKGSIKAEAFQGIDKLTSINCHDITAIEDRAFESCTSLEKLIMPHVEEIGENAFRGCSVLSEVYLDDKDMLGPVMIKLSKCGLKQRIDIYFQNIFAISMGNGQEYLFSDTVPERIRDGIFSVPHCDLTNTLENIIPYRAFGNIDAAQLGSIKAKATTIIEDNAFEGLGVHSIEIPNVKEIGDNAFKDCRLLHNIIVNDNMVDRVKELLQKTNLSQQVYVYVNGTVVYRLHDDLNKTILNEALFFKESWLGYEIKIPDIYTKINDYTFYEMEMVSLDTNKVTVIGDRVLNSCDNLKRLYMPNVEEIGSWFCSECPNLKEITVKNETIAKMIKERLDTGLFSNEHINNDINIYIVGNDKPFLVIKKYKSDIDLS